MLPPTRRLALALMALALAAVTVSCGSSPDEEAKLVIYSGRSEELVSGIIDEFEQQSGVDVEVRYGDTAEMAAQLLEEGDKSPADVFFAQDAGALGAVSEAGLFADLGELTGLVPARYAGADNDWVGVTGRARVVAYDPDQVAESDLPEDVGAFTDPSWRGRVAIAPTNASFQAFVTAYRLTEGEAAAQQFLEDLVANDVQKYESNLTIMQALEAGEVSVGLVNHYYLRELADEIGADNVRTQIKFLAPGSAGALVNVAGVGLLDREDAHPEAKAFVEFLLDEATQATFVETTGEYPLVAGVDGPAGLPSLSELGDGAGIELGALESLDETIALLTEVGLI